MGLRDWVYRRYARQLKRRLDSARLPEHVAVVIDGNRRWAKQMGYDNPSVGHRHGAEHIDDVLGWAAELGISHVTVFVASSDNLRKRGGPEVDYLMRMVEEVIAGRMLGARNRWQIHVSGRIDDLPDSTVHALKSAEDHTSRLDTGLHLTVAIGYDGREEIVDAVRSLLDTEAAAGTSLTDLAQRLTPDDISAHVYAAGRPDPDLIIRTSGERRLSTFLLWQSTRTELYFCDVYWPGFRYVDFLRALRTYANRRVGV